MFKKFTKEEDVTATSQMKTSVARGIRQTVLEQYPTLQEYIDDILQKKATSLCS